MKHHRLTVVAVLLAAVAAFAVTHNFSGSINTPAVATWVDGSGNEVGPAIVFAQGADNQLFLDSSTGFLWRVQDIMFNPTAVGQSLSAVFYITNNCTGTKYLLAQGFTLPGLVQTAPNSGTFYVPGSGAAVTALSFDLSGTCYPVTQTTDLYLAVGPVSAPTLPSAPWHLELR